MKKRHGAEQIVAMLRQADVALGICRTPPFRHSFTTCQARLINPSFADDRPKILGHEMDGVFSAFVHCAGQPRQ